MDLSPEFGLSLAITLLIAAILPVSIPAALRGRPIAQARPEA